MRVLFIGFALPETEFQQLLTTDGFMPTQTQRFGWSVIEAMQSAGITVDVVSAAPASDYPHNSRWRFQGGRFTAAGGTSGLTLSFINVTGAKHVTRFVSAMAACRRMVRRHRPDAIVVHGVHSPFIWVAVRLARKLDVPSVVILTDAPSIPTVYDGRIAGHLKKGDQALILGGLQRTTGVLALTEDLARDFAPGRPWLQFEGIARGVAPTEQPPADLGASPNVVYAGGLAQGYGVAELLQAIEVSSGSWRLHLYGAGELLDDVEAAARRNDRVVFHGLVGPAELSAAYQSADLLVNPRPTTASFVRYSFPSKLLEYLATGRPVMTTRLPSIPQEYDDHLVYCGDGPEEIAAAMDGFFSDGSPTPPGGRDFVIETRGTAAQGVRIRSFLNELAGRLRTSR